MKILVLRFSSIGDIVLCSPVVRCLKQQLGAEVHFLTKQRFESLLTPNPYIDRVFTFENSISEILPSLRRERYDLVVDLHNNIRSMQVKISLRRPWRSFQKLNVQKWLLTSFGINLLPDVHIVHRYMATIAHLGVRYDGAGLDYFIPPGEEISPSRIDPSLSNTPYTALVIGATHATKRLTVPQLVDLCKKITSPVVLLGGPDEAEAGRTIAAEGGMHVFNTCGQLNLHQSASLVRQAARVITHDTGLMHIAAAFHRPLISVWGSTAPAFGMYPFLPGGAPPARVVETTGLSCRPCSKIGYDVCPKGHFRCMKNIQTGQILGEQPG